ncbi:hypothetical protein CSO01_21840 [Cellulomonas soli]|uniref:Uncharacterized protein n=1 Tax=Cellulomonas soli TaxID=931535 RepID=A0A512PE31_9CELL|nr:hypothetical protein CSO01_21840 [Cellulomonas soli]
MQRPGRATVPKGTGESEMRVRARCVAIVAAVTAFGIVASAPAKDRGTLNPDSRMSTPTLRRW